MDEFERFLRNPGSVAPLTPRTFVARFFTDFLDTPKLISSLPNLLNSCSNVPASLRAILTPNAESPEGYVHRVLAELELSRCPVSMCSLLREERQKRQQNVSSLTRWSSVKNSSSLSTWKSQHSIVADLDDFRDRINQRNAQDEQTRRNLQHFLLFKKNRNEFYLRQQRHEDAQVRQHFRDLRRQLAAEKTEALKQQESANPLVNTLRKNRQDTDSAEKRRLELLADRAHQALVQRLTREHRVQVRKEDYQRAAEKWQATLLSERRSPQIRTP